MNNTGYGGIAIVINNRDGRILPSETFLTAHINQLPKPVTPLVGIPGGRILINEGKRSVPSRSIVPLSIRWLIRRVGLSSVAKQDRRAFAHFLRQRNITVVLAEYGPAAVSVMDACRDASVPLIAHFHGFDAYKHDIITTYGDRYLKLFNEASAVIAVSEHMRKQLLSIGAKEDKTFVNSCGADIPEGLSAEPESSAVRFLMVGRLVEKKAPFLSIMAFSKVAAKFPESQLNIIGEGPLFNVCQQMANSLKISDRVIFHGALPHSKVLEMMQKSRCFIQHSVRTPDGDHEGTPVAVLEAMGIGLPVVSTRHGGILDVVENGETGSLVDEYDVDEMAKAMLSYAENAALAQKVGEKARFAITENWTSKKSVGRLWDIIEKSLNEENQLSRRI